jgi:hypothetical protein
MERTEVAQDRDRWQAFINAIISLQILQNVGNSLTEDLLPYQERLYH